MNFHNWMLRRRQYALFGFFLSVITSFHAHAAVWDTKAPMPTARFALAATSIDGVVYALGGVVANGCSAFSALEAYDPATNTWTAKASMPTARYHVGATSVNGVLYAIGGGNFCGPDYNVVEAYDPLTNTWSARSSMSIARRAPAVAVVNGIVYAIGGLIGGTALTSMEAYDPATNTWTPKAPMPRPRIVFAVGVVNGILYAVGGSNINTNQLIAEVDAYDPATNTWTTVGSPMPTPRSYLGAAVVDGKIFTAGGYGSSGPSAAVESFDPISGGWTAHASMPTARAELSASGASGAMYVLGGFNGVALATNEAFIPVVNFPPTAVAGPDQSIHAGQTVHLDGSGSFDDNTASQLLQYAWSFVARPGGSTAVLLGADTAAPSFVADAVGSYVAQLVVTDEGGLVSAPSTVTISSTNILPTAHAGETQAVVVGSAVALNGAGSSDPNGDPLTYSWTFVERPAGSGAALTNDDTVNPGFTPDLPGQYVVGLVVNDGFGDSAQAQVIVTAISAQDYAENRSADALNHVAAMSPAQFQAPGHQNALSNFISQAIAALQSGKVAQAKSKLKDAVSRTDGVALRGAVDGNGPGMDWITDPAAQEAIYRALTDALSVL